MSLFSKSAVGRFFSKRGSQTPAEFIFSWLLSRLLRRQLTLDINFAWFLPRGQTQHCCEEEDNRTHRPACRVVKLCSESRRLCKLGEVRVADVQKDKLGRCIQSHFTDLHRQKEQHLILFTTHAAAMLSSCLKPTRLEGTSNLLSYHGAAGGMLGLVG